MSYYMDRDGDVYDDDGSRMDRRGSVWTDGNGYTIARLDTDTGVVRDISGNFLGRFITNSCGVVTVEYSW